MEYRFYSDRVILAQTSTKLGWVLETKLIWFYCLFTLYFVKQWCLNKSIKSDGWTCCIYKGFVAVLHLGSVNVLNVIGNKQLKHDVIISTHQPSHEIFLWIWMDHCFHNNHHWINYQNIPHCQVATRLFGKVLNFMP